MRASSFQPNPQDRLPHRRGTAAFEQMDAAVDRPHGEVIDPKSLRLTGLFLLEPDHPYRSGIRKWFKNQVNRRIRRQRVEEE